MANSGTPRSCDVLAKNERLSFPLSGRTMGTNRPCSDYARRESRLLLLTPAGSREGRWRQKSGSVATNITRRWRQIWVGVDKENRSSATNIVGWWRQIEWVSGDNGSLATQSQLLALCLAIIELTNHAWVETSDGAIAWMHDIWRGQISVAVARALWL